jgi:hypothetical protein
LEELVSGLLRPKLFPFGKLSKAKPAAHHCSEEVGIELRTIATLTLAVRRSNHSARSYLYSIFMTQTSLKYCMLYAIDTGSGGHKWLSK